MSQQLKKSNYPLKEVVEKDGLQIASSFDNNEKCSHVFRCMVSSKSTSLGTLKGSVIHSNGLHRGK